MTERSPGRAASILEIPQDVLDSSGLTIDQVRIELAVHLYEERRLSVGKAHELAGLSFWDFRQVLGARGIPPHFGIEDLEQDLETLTGLEASFSSWIGLGKKAPENPHPQLTSDDDLWEQKGGRGHGTKKS